MLEMSESAIFRLSPRIGTKAPFGNAIFKYIHADAEEKLRRKFCKYIVYKYIDGKMCI